jgi:phage baseplate assembly protein W
MFEQSTTVIQQTMSNFKNLILTKKGERVNEPELGCDLWRILFEPLTEDTLENARLSVVSAIDRWLPFIELTDFQITKTDENNIVDIKCLYRFRANPSVQSAVNISSAQLGLPTVGFNELSSNPTPEEVSSTQQKISNARRIRRP